MTQQGESADQALLAHAERQTKAIEDIRGAVMFLLALAILFAVARLIVVVNHV
jgi:hypothetical protein